MEKIQELFKKIIEANITNSIIVVIIGIALYNFFTHIINVWEKNSKSKLFSSNKGKTYYKLLKSIIRYFFIFITILILMQINGINISSVIAGVGIFGAIFGFAIQDLLKDLIRGSTILSDEYFHVGDIVKYKEIEGKVILIGLKSTKIQDLSTNNIISIANRNIEEIQVVSPFVYIRIPMPYGLRVEKAEMVISEITESIVHNNNVNDCKYLGVTELADSSIQYLLKIDCNQQFKLQVKRDALRAILVIMAKNKIEVPYTQIDVHNK